MGKTSAAVKNRYNAKAYDFIKITVKKGEKAKIMAHAAAQGKSLSAYIAEIIKLDMLNAELDKLTANSSTVEPPDLSCQSS